MVFTFIVVIIVILTLVAFSKKNGTQISSTNGQSQMNLDVPNPETANPKKVIHFISNYDKDTVQQVYKQLKDLNVLIPENLDRIYREKIDMGYIFKEDYYWRTSIERYQRENENLDSFSQAYSFELKGLHVPTYKKHLKDCIVFDKVTLKKDPHNKFDENAIKVVASSGLIGHVPADETEIVNEILKKEHKAFIEDIMDIDGYIDASIKVYYN